ncbi:KASH domain [Trinorchestia longiramus]|nr:KASH domain [Trinorchestia longiramus]
MQRCVSRCEAFHILEHGSTSGSDLDEPLSKCRRLSASSCESLCSTGSSLRPQSSTALSRNSSDLSATSSRGASPARSTSAASEFETPLFTERPIEKPVVGKVTSPSEPVGEDETDCNLIHRSRPTKAFLGSASRKRSSDSSRSKRSTSRDDECRKAVRRRAESIASRRKPRRKKRRLAKEVRSDEDRLRSTRSARWQDNDLNISETGSYIEHRHRRKPRRCRLDDYVCMSEGDEPCHSSYHRTSCDQIVEGSLARDVLPTLYPVVQGEPSKEYNCDLLNNSPGDQDVPEELPISSSVTETDAAPDLLKDQNIRLAENTKGDVEMTVAPRKSDVREANKINGNMESQETKQEMCPQQSSPNRAIFEFKHQDTDVEDSPKLERKTASNLPENKFNTIVEDDAPVASSKSGMRGSLSSTNYNLNLSSFGRGGRKSWPRRHEELEEEYDSDGLQKIIDSSIMEPDWLKVESDDGLEDPSCEGGSDEPPALETMDTGSEEGLHQSRNSLSGPTKLDSSLHQLVSAAEHLVKATPLPSPIVSPRTPISFNLGGSRRAPPTSLGPLSYGLTSPREVKHERIQSWLATQPCAPALLDSCDASGEMTTGESEGDSSSESADYTVTGHIANDLPQSVVSTPVCERPSELIIGSEPTKAVSRNRRRRAGDRRRPWSVLESGSRQTNTDATSTPSKPQTGAREKVQHLASFRNSFTSSDPTLVSSNSEALLPRTVEKCSSGSVLNVVPEGEVSPASIELRGCASDSALHQEVSKGLGRGRVGDISARQISEQRSESSGTSTAAAPDVPVTPTTPTAAAYPAVPEGVVGSPASGPPSAVISPTGLGMQRRRKHKIRRRSNISLHTRGSDSGSDKAGTGGHRTSISASDCGVPAGRFMGGIVKSSSFAGHPLTTPQLPSSPTGTVTGLLPDTGFICCPTDTVDPLSTDKALSAASVNAKSSSFLLRSSVVNVPLRPQSYSVPLTVLSSSSDHSDKSPTGSPLKGPCSNRLPSDLVGFSCKASCDTDTAGNQEDVSSHSEQAWDPFLENKYLSENYSEDLDTEAAKKFLEFGDDYRRYIDSDGGSSFFGVPKLRNLNKRGFDQTCTPSERSLPSSRLTDPIELEDINESPVKSAETTIMKSPETFKNKEREGIANADHPLSDGVSQSDHAKSQCSQVSEKRTKNDKTERRIHGHSSDLSNRSGRKHREASRGELDSDSDIEDIVNLIKESRSHLVVAENVLSKHSDEEASLHLMDYTEVLSLCSTNLDGLPDLLSSLQHSSGAHHHVSALNELIQNMSECPDRLDGFGNRDYLYDTIKLTGFDERGIKFDVGSFGLTHGPEKSSNYIKVDEVEDTSAQVHEKQIEPVNMDGPEGELVVQTQETGSLSDKLVVDDVSREVTDDSEHSNVIGDGTTISVSIPDLERTISSVREDVPPRIDGDSDKSATYKTCKELDIGSELLTVISDELAENESKICESSAMPSISVCTERDAELNEGTMNKPSTENQKPTVEGECNTYVICEEESSTMTPPSPVTSDIDVCAPSAEVNSSSKCEKNYESHDLNLKKSRSSSPNLITFNEAIIFTDTSNDTAPSESDGPTCSETTKEISSDLSNTALEDGDKTKFADGEGNIIELIYDSPSLCSSKSSILVPKALASFVEGSPLIETRSNDDIEINTCSQSCINTTGDTDIMKNSDKYEFPEGEEKKVPPIMKTPETFELSDEISNKTQDCKDNPTQGLLTEVIDSEERKDGESIESFSKVNETHSELNDTKKKLAKLSDKPDEVNSSTNSVNKTEGKCLNTGIAESKTENTGNAKPKSSKSKKKGKKNKLDSKEEVVPTTPPSPVVERRRLIRGTKWRQDVSKFRDSNPTASSALLVLGKSDDSVSDISCSRKAECSDAEKTHENGEDSKNSEADAEEISKNKLDEHISATDSKCDIPTVKFTDFVPSICSSVQQTEENTDEKPIDGFDEWQLMQEIGRIYDDAFANYFLLEVPDADPKPNPLNRTLTRVFINAASPRENSDVKNITSDTDSNVNEIIHEDLSPILVEVCETAKKEHPETEYLSSNSESNSQGSVLSCVACPIVRSLTSQKISEDSDNQGWEDVTSSDENKEEIKNLGSTGEIQEPAVSSSAAETHLDLDNTRDSLDSNDDYTYYIVGCTDLKTNSENSADKITSSESVIHARAETPDDFEFIENEAFQSIPTSETPCSESSTTVDVPLPNISASHQLSWSTQEVSTESVPIDPSLLALPDEVHRTDNLLYVEKCDCTPLNLKLAEGFPSPTADSSEESEILVPVLFNDDTSVTANCAPFTPPDSPIPVSVSRPVSSASSARHGSGEGSGSVSREMSTSPNEMQTCSIRDTNLGNTDDVNQSYKPNKDVSDGEANMQHKPVSALSLPTVRKISRKKVSKKKLEKRLQRKDTEYLVGLSSILLPAKPVNDVPEARFSDSEEATIATDSTMKDASSPYEASACKSFLNTANIGDDNAGKTEEFSSSKINVQNLLQKSTTDGLIQRWESVQHRASSRQQQSQQLHSLHSTIKQLHMKLDALQQHYADSSGRDGCASSSAGCHSASASAVGVPSESGASAGDDIVSIGTTSSSSLQSKATADVHSLQQLRDRLAIAQAREDRLSEIQDELSQLNMSVHRHTVENSHQLPLFQHQLQHLYQKADHLSHCINDELSRLCSACAAMETWNKQADELRRCLQQDDAALSRLQQAVNGGPAALSRLQLQQEGEGESASVPESFSGTTKGLAKLLAQSGSVAQTSKSGGGSSLYSSSSRLSDSGTSGYESCSSDDLSERERRLDALKRLAAELESTLHPHSLAWTNIKKTICNAESELSSLQKRCRELLLKTAERVAPVHSSALCSRTSRRRGLGNQSRICRSNRSSPNRSNRSGLRAPKNGWLWRVVRFALPIQAALLLLLCVSCLLEPSCCDSFNNLNLDLGPQVRFVHGLPPV